MSRTLFIYIFKDLLRIFMLAVAVLSTIMTFGGLLRPLYEFGLDIGQVSAVLTWSTPAMWAYSLPIAALFATTIVYGRLGADNEITACRAAGISHLSMVMPGLLLGLTTSIISLVLLCLVVPACTLKVERIIYSNLAKLVAGQIERTHQIKIDRGKQPVTIFAQSAQVVPPDPKRPADQAVQLIGPTIVQYEAQERNKVPVPVDFFMARTATAVIHQESGDADDVSLLAYLDNGAKFPRTYTQGSKKSTQMSVQTTRFGPMPLPSPVRENTKFMDIFHLRAMLAKPEESSRIRGTLREFIDRDQQAAFLNMLATRLNGPDGFADIGAGEEHYRITRGSAPVKVFEDKLYIGGDLGGTPGTFANLRENNQPGIVVTASEIRIKSYPNSDERKIDVDVEMLDCVVKVGDESSSQRDFSRPVTVPMPSDIAALTSRPISDYITSSLSPDDRNKLQRDLFRLNNSIIAELWARVMFGLSCLILVTVGCSLGMMFRSGNFLSAFAISVVPALLSIALIVTGQHTAENVPIPLPPHWTNTTLDLGITLICSGNVVVLVIGTALIVRLWRQ